VYIKDASVPLVREVTNESTLGYDLVLPTYFRKGTLTPRSFIYMPSVYVS